MTGQQIDRDRLREGIAKAEEDGCGVYSDPRDLTALLDALDQAEKERDDAMITAERMTSYARKAEAHLKAVQELLDHADRGHRPVIETWDLRDALDR